MNSAKFAASLRSRFAGGGSRLRLWTAGADGRATERGKLQERRWVKGKAEEDGKGANRGRTRKYGTGAARVPALQERRHPRPTRIAFRGRRMEAVRNRGSAVLWHAPRTRASG